MEIEEVIELEAMDWILSDGTGVDGREAERKEKVKRWKNEEK